MYSQEVRLWTIYQKGSGKLQPLSCLHTKSIVKFVTATCESNNLENNNKYNKLFERDKGVFPSSVESRKLVTFVIL